MPKVKGALFSKGQKVTKTNKLFKKKLDEMVNFKKNHSAYLKQGSKDPNMKQCFSQNELSKIMKYHADNSINCDSSYRLSKKTKGEDRKKSKSRLTQKKSAKESKKKCLKSGKIKSKVREFLLTKKAQANSSLLKIPDSKRKSDEDRPSSLNRKIANSILGHKPKLKSKPSQNPNPNNNRHTILHELKSLDR